MLAGTMRFSAHRLNFAIALLTGATALTGCKKNEISFNNEAPESSSDDEDEPEEDPSQTSMGGSGSGDSADPPLAAFFETLTPATAFYNLNYEASLLSSDDSSLTVELKEGTLPPGLSLSSTGAISGKPEEVGTFELTLRVSNSDGRSESVVISLTVDQKRWAAIVTEDGAVGAESELTLVDYTSGLFPKIVVSTGMQDFSKIHLGTDGYEFDPKFSPDGKWLAYGADKEVDGYYDLYLVDVSGKDPVGDTKITLSGAVEHLQGFSWSADSKHLTFAEGHKIYAVSLDGDEIGEPQEINDGFSPRWIGSDVLTFTLGEPHYVLFDGAEFGSARAVTGSGALQIASSESLRGAFRWEVGPCGMDSSMIDFAQGELYEGPQSAATHYSPDLSWLVTRTSDTWELFDSTAYASTSTPVLTGSATLGNACSVRWSPNSRWVAFKTSVGELSLFNTNTEANSSVSGLSDVWMLHESDSTYTEFSSDSQWLSVVVGTNRLVWMVPMGEDTPGSAVQLNTGNFGGTNLFTPDATGHIHYDYTTVSNYYYVDLTADFPSTPRAISNTAAGVGSSILSVSNDSTTFAYGAKSADTRIPEDLYFVDLTNEEGVGRRVTTFANASGYGLKYLTFQP